MTRDPLAENIFFFIPNVIGYFRVILALVSFYYMPDDHIAASIAYILSAFLDAFDGYAARALNQSTKFGALLDQLTDRCALLGLLTVLCHLYPEYMFAFQLSMIIDIASHWIHVWASLMQGKSSHKFIDPSQNFILKLYYTNKPILFSFCAANESFYGGLYLLHFTEGPFIPFLEMGLIRAVVVASAPFSVTKTFISLIQLVTGCINVGIVDVSDRVNERAKNR
jgi:CDP-diacylglycerol--inositol 3-phosphatidyltransferase